MRVVIDAPAALGSRAAEHYAQLLEHRPDAVLGLATGSSPIGVYDELAARVAGGLMSFARASAFTLDEYVGLPVGHPCSYREVIHHDLITRIDLPGQAVHTPDGEADDLEAAARDFDAQIAAAGGVDLQILGIGSNGHIAFNEPGTDFGARTRCAPLTEQTRRDNARFFDGDLDLVPTQCLTQGIGTILEAREIVLIATGAAKADAVRELVEGAPNVASPATALQAHPNVTVYLDPAAAAHLSPNARARCEVSEAYAS